MLAAAAILFTSACGFDGGYRYPCQNPDNWEQKECNYPICTIEGNCPNDVLPRCGTQLGRMCSDVYD